MRRSGGGGGQGRSDRRVGRGGSSSSSRRRRAIDAVEPLRRGADLRTDVWAWHFSRWNKAEVEDSAVGDDGQLRVVELEGSNISEQIWCAWPPGSEEPLLKLTDPALLCRASAELKHQRETSAKAKLKRLQGTAVVEALRKGHVRGPYDERRRLAGWRESTVAGGGASASAAAA